MKIKYFSKFSSAQVLDNIQQRADKETFGALFSFFTKPRAAAKVKENAIRLRRRKFYGNSFESLFYGEVIQSPSGCEISGKFKMRPFAFIFMCIWFSGLALITLVTAKQLFFGQNCDKNLIFYLFGMIGLGFAILGIGKWLAKGDKIFLEEFLKDCCNRESAKGETLNSKEPFNTRLTLIWISIGMAFLIALFSFVHSLVKNGDAFGKSKMFLQTNQVVIQKMGEITKTSLPFLGYTIEIHGPTGDANFKINLNGTKGKGIAYVDLKKEAGEWMITHAKLVDGSGFIELH